MGGRKFLRSTWTLNEGVWHRLETRVPIPDHPQKCDKWVERAVFQYHPIVPLAPGAHEVAAVSPQALLFPAFVSKTVSRGWLMPACTHEAVVVTDALARLGHGGSVGCHCLQNFVSDGGRKSYVIERKAKSKSVFITGRFKVETQNDGTDDVVALLQWLNGEETRIRVKHVQSPCKITIKEDDGIRPRLLAVGVGEGHGWTGDRMKGIRVVLALHADIEEPCDRMLVDACLRNEHDLFAVGAGVAGGCSLMGDRNCTVHAPPPQFGGVVDYIMRSVIRARSVEAKVVVEMEDSASAWKHENMELLVHGTDNHVHVLDLSLIHI